MATASVRDLRTSFPRVKAQLARDGEVVVTERGKPTFVLRPYTPPPNARGKGIDYFGRLTQKQPRPLSDAATRALDEADRGER